MRRLVTVGESDAFQYMIRDNPTLLPAAPPDPSTHGRAMTHREEDEVHPCLRCAARANMAIIASTKRGPRWLDLCYDCVDWLTNDH